MKNSELIPDYRDILRAEYERVYLEKGYEYQLKDFAKVTGLSRPFLSQLLNHRAHLSIEKAKIVAESLGWIKGKKQYFLDLVEASVPRLKGRNQASLLRLKQKHLKYRKLNESVLDQLNWRHFALLQLIQIYQPHGQLEDFEKRVELGGDDLIAALDFLERAGLAAQNEGRWSCVDTEHEIVSFSSSHALRMYHAQLLQQAALALGQPDPSQRQFDSFIMTFDRADIRSAQDAIRKFQSEFYAKFQRGRGNAVYCLGTQFFRIDREV
ncbi:MAG: TIGR02147 family protein [Bdellovibrionales bacterium]|nr:TIGR02147 family protein [Bdellovibrionales bacterium]